MKTKTMAEWQAERRALTDFAPDSHAGRIFALVCGPENAPKPDTAYFYWLAAGEIAQRLAIHKSEASRQLKMLEERGLVERRRQGRHIYFRSTLTGQSAYAEQGRPQPVLMMSVEYSIHPLSQESFWALSRNVSPGSHTKLKIGTREECEQVFESIREAIASGAEVVVHDTLAADIDRALNS